MNASLLAVLNDAERLLVAETDRDNLSALDEDAAIEPGRREMRGEVGGDGAGKDAVQQRSAGRAAEHLADRDRRGRESASCGGVMCARAGRG